MKYRIERKSKCCVCGKGTVKKWVYTPEGIKMAKELRKEGLVLREIAKKMGIPSVNTVANMLSKS